MATMYCTVQDVRDEGIGDPPTDARLTQLITEASEYIDLVTRIWFDARTMTLKLDGNGRRTIPLDIAIIDVTEVRVNTDVIDSTLYVVYNRYRPDDRRNPRLKYKRYTSRPSIFTGISYAGSWYVGEQNVEIDGTFGYVDTDPDGSNQRTPELIKNVCVKLVIRTIPLLGDTDSLLSSLISSPGMLRSETTDSHSYTLSNAGVEELQRIGNRAALGLTGDSEIDSILLKYIAMRPRYAEIV